MSAYHFFCFVCVCVVECARASKYISVEYTFAGAALFVCVPRVCNLFNFRSLSFVCLSLFFIHFVRRKNTEFRTAKP